MLASHHGERSAATAVPVPATPASSAKRKRNNISDACTACRRSKVKCDEAKPCTRCVNHGWRDSCVSWRQHKMTSQRRECGVVRADFTALMLLPPPPPPPPLPKPPAGAVQSLVGPSHSPPHGELGALFGPGEARPALSSGERCASQGAGDGVESAASKPQPPSPPLSCSGGDKEHFDQRAALSEADTDLSDAEDDAFWRSLEHLKAIPIAFDIFDCDAAPRQS